MKRILLILLLLFILVPMGILGVFVYQVVQDAQTRIERGAIDQVIASETPVYYSDGHTPIGVFFDQTHRKYIRYEDIPKSFIKALIASEDQHFFEHNGFDLKAIVRSLVANIQAGRVVQGGSTITQQTAKNIFKREKRSYKAKLKEVIQAFLLERRYTKEDILEMYANQFFVTGYGKGLQIASNYFFGKDAQDLDLVESAFIVGSVKGPNRYNPFIKKNPVEKEKAKDLAKARKDYVLGNMLEMNFINEREYDAAKKRPVPFQEGQITYRLNVVLDYVKAQLESPYFQDMLKAQGIDNIATAGLSIYTSVDETIQNTALKRLRTHLPIMDVKLSGYDPMARLADWEDRFGYGLRKPKNELPFLAEITDVDKDKENSRLVVTWKNGGGVIDYDGFKEMGAAWLKGKLGPWKKFDRDRASVFLNQIQVGDLVPVKLVASPGTETRNGEDTLELTMIPELDGGVVVLHKGMIKAMAGGFFDRYFNRAVDAKRQVGSIFKPMVYAAALELKWNLLDALKNERDLFQFEDTAYVPRPDHEPKSDMVSLAWAGVKSENLATVWLLYHLTDHLNMSEFRKLTEIVGLARKPNEPYPAYKKRIRDRYGIVVDNKTLMQAAFDTAKQQVRTDLIFSGQERCIGNLKRIQFEINKDQLDMEKPHVRNIARYEFQRLERLNQTMRRQFQAIQQGLNRAATGTDDTRPLTPYLKHFYRTIDRHTPPRLVYTAHPEALVPPALVQVSPRWLRENRPGPGMVDHISIDGLLPAGTINLLNKTMLAAYKKLAGRRRYSLDSLYRVRDFRTLVNLSFVEYLSKRLGISTDLDPVLSFPLGPNAISIMETAVAYETLLTGDVYPLSSPMDPAMVPIIQKIVDRQGKTLYRYEPKPRQMVSKRVSALITEILEKVMTRGTGRRAKTAVRVFDVPIPTFGKTGTANRFTNSSFVGMVPGLNQASGALSPKNGYVIAAYVGYDDNRPMKGKHLTIYGSSGALPLWIDTANAVVDSSDYQKGLQPADVAFGALLQRPEGAGMKAIRVSPASGLPIPPYTGADPSYPHIRTEAVIQGSDLQLERVFEPWPGPDMIGDTKN